MICAACGNSTDVEPCVACSAAPRLGSYALVRALGHGTTWLALDRDGGEVALKELHVNGEAKARELLVREVRVLRELNHPAIPRYLADFAWGVGRQRVHCVVQEYVPGRTLEGEILDRRFTVEDVLDVIERIFDPLAYMHARSPPVVHRDLKPANVILRPDGRVALVDFGAVRDAWKGTLGGSTVAGTFGYMAPEQFQGDASPATDVYGVAALAVALLARKDPSSLQDRQGRLKWRGFTRVPPRIAALLDGMLDPDPSLRPRDAGSALALLQAIRAEGWTEPPRAPQSRPSPPPPWRGVITRVAERPVVEDPRFFPPSAPPSDPPATAPSGGGVSVSAQWYAALVGGLVVGGLLSAGFLAFASPGPIEDVAHERPQVPRPQEVPYVASAEPNRPLVVLPGEGVAASSHVLLWYEQRVTSPEVQRCLGGGTVGGSLILAIDGSTGFLSDRPSADVTCLRWALRGVETSLVPIEGMSLLFPARLGTFTWSGGARVALLDSSPLDGELLLTGPHVFAKGEHADILFKGAVSKVAVPAGSYVTLVDGQLGRVAVAAGRRCVYTWDAVGGWYGGCL